MSGLVDIVPILQQMMSDVIFYTRTIFAPAFSHKQHLYMNLTHDCPFCVGVKSLP
jgi:hypothetical protein